MKWSVLLKSGQESPQWKEELEAEKITTTDDFLWLSTNDNASFSSSCVCAPQPTCPTTDSSLLYKVLRWFQLALLRGIRRVEASPLLLLAVPLFLLGLLVGYLIGQRRQTERRGYSERKKEEPGATAMDRDVVPSKRSRAEQASKQPPLPRTPLPLPTREEQARKDLSSNRDTLRESGVPTELLPNHVAVVMDGNRRYGQAVYGSAQAGHWDGSRKVVELAKWCLAEHISMLTVYAFSTENWQRPASEVASLMRIFIQYCEELRVEAVQRGIRVHVISTDTSQLPAAVRAGLARLQHDTRHCEQLKMNICLSYGSRSELVQASRALARDCVDGRLGVEDISEETLQQRLLARTNVDLLIRTSGEMRLSNFLLWQVAYAELFFVDKNWPALEKDDLLDILRSYAHGRRRRFGK